MAINDILNEIRQINASDMESAELYGEQEIGPSGIVINEILAVDDKTLLKITPKVKQFYQYSVSWRHQAIELFWPDPRKLNGLYRNYNIPQTIDSDFSNNSGFTQDLSIKACALLAVDDPQSVFQRAYLAFTPSLDEAKVVDIGSEVRVFDDIEDYLEFWLLVFRSSSKK